jgi:type IV fimbrial biogenesis protein FimT
VKVQIDYMSQPQVLKNSQSGFTIMEMLITLTVLAILVAAALPSMSGLADRQKFVGTAEQIYGHLQQARSEAIARSIPTYANFDDGAAAWAYGINSSAPGCDVAVTDRTDANACTIRVDDGDGVDGDEDLILMRFTSADHDDVEMVITAFTPMGSTEITFDPVRGTATGGTVQLTSSSTDLELNIVVSVLGRVEICSPDADHSVPNYGAC